MHNFKMQIIDDFGGGVADFTVRLQKVVIPAVGEQGNALADVFVQIAVFVLVVLVIGNGNIFNYVVKGAFHGGGGFFAHFFTPILITIGQMLCGLLEICCSYRQIQFQFYLLNIARASLGPIGVFLRPKPFIKYPPFFTSSVNTCSANIYRLSAVFRLV